MEGRSVILSVLVLNLVMAQLHFQVDAKSCCPSTTARNIYNSCRFAGGSRDMCASLSGCKIQSSSTCPSGWDKLTTEHDSGEGRIEYCKLGCVISVCNIMSSLQNSDAREIVNAAAAHCTKSCSVFCAKGSTDAPEIMVSTE